MTMPIRTFRNLPVGTDYETFREAVRRQLALWVQSRTPGRGGRPVRREVELTEDNESLREVWRRFNARRPGPGQAYCRADMRVTGGVVREVVFSADHLRVGPGPPPRPPRGVEVRRRMRRVMRDLGLRSRPGTFAYWFCQQYAAVMPVIPADRNPPMHLLDAPVSGMLQCGGVVYGCEAFAELSGYWWQEMEEFHARPPARINNTHFMGRQKGGLQDVINHWAVRFDTAVRNTAGERVWMFQGFEEYITFHRVMSTCPPEVEVPAFMIGQGPRPIRPCSGFIVTTRIPNPPPLHSRCPCCPAGPRPADCRPM
jgi:hypothetical protein